jgi:hypothetical protein
MYTDIESGQQAQERSMTASVEFVFAIGKSQCEMVQAGALSLRLNRILSLTTPLVTLAHCFTSVSHLPFTCPFESLTDAPSLNSVLLTRLLISTSSPTTITTPTRAMDPTSTQGHFASGVDMPGHPLPSRLEKLPRELQERIYFYLGVPVTGFCVHTCDETCAHHGLLTELHKMVLTCNHFAEQCLPPGPLKDQ